jgi:hypothetical protein
VAGERGSVTEATAIDPVRQAASCGDDGRGRVRGAGDDGERGGDPTDAAWRRGEAKSRAMVINDPRYRKMARGERAGIGRIGMTSARV